MDSIFRLLYRLLPPRDRRVVLILLCIMLVAAVMEAVGIASVLPFIAVLSKPEVVESNRFLSLAYNSLGFASPNSFLSLLGVVFLVAFFFGLFSRAASFFAQAKFANNRMSLFSSRLFAGYLTQDYEWFLNKHSSTLNSAVLSEVNKVISEALFPSLQIIAHAMVVLLLITLLVAVDPVLAASVVVVLGGSYVAIYASLRGMTKRAGKIGFAANRARFRTAREALGGIKDLKVKGLEQLFMQRFKRDSELLAKSRVTEQLIGQLPSFAIQGVIFGGMMLIILYLMTRYGDIATALPVLAMYAIAGYRIMPSLQNIYRHMITLRNTQPVLEAVYEDFKLHVKSPIAPQSGITMDKLCLGASIKLDHVYYRYPGAASDALVDLTIAIERYTTVAFVGPTGCGKTTTVDVILGLLKVRSGSLRVDGQEIVDQRISAWQKNIGYVPQDIYLADESIAANIAYGLSESQIDMNAVEKVARIARLHDFVTGQLPNGYSTIVGEQGVRLSGGQRQRIGIARALYHDPDVLILDEATSALDNKTEQEVMEAVHSLAKKKTIIIVAHRLTTIAKCDTIFVLDSGRLAALGSYDELLKTSSAFRAIAQPETSNAETAVPNTALVVH